MPRPESPAGTSSHPPGRRHRRAAGPLASAAAALLSLALALLVALQASPAAGFLVQRPAPPQWNRVGTFQVSHSRTSRPNSPRSRTALWDLPPQQQASSNAPSSQPPLWPPKGFRPFKSLREESGDLDTTLEAHRDSLLELPSSQFFAGFRLKELDEVDATAPSSIDKLTLGFKGLLWFVFLLWPYMTFGLVCSFGAQLLVWSDSDPFASPIDIKDFPDLKTIHGFVGTILGFTIGFRTNAAYDRYYQGRTTLSTILENSRAIIRDVYSFNLKPPTVPNAPDDDAVIAMSDDIRRRLDILFAFTRQSVRESVLGFDPASELANVPFTNSTFYMDPTQPQLLDLLSKEEAQRYAAMSPRSRPGAVAAEINIILQILGTRIQYVDAFLGKVQGHLSRITEAQATMLRIRDTPVPYPYLLILRVATYLFVYTTPLLYQAGWEGRFLGVQLLVLAYYGILSIGESIENPFAWDEFDINFENFAQQLERDTQSLADTLRQDRTAFLKELMRPPDEDE